MPKYMIGDIIEGTDCFGDVVVKDILKSETTGQWCYAVEIVDNKSIMLCWEAELNRGDWKVI